MNKKYIPWILAGAIAIAVGGYFLHKKLQRKSRSAIKNDRKIVLNIPKLKRY